jgi:hypothetical protein
MDNLKWVSGIFNLILRQESTFWSFWKYIVLILSILIKNYEFSGISVKGQFMKRKNIEIKFSNVTALHELISFQ